MSQPTTTKDIVEQPPPSTNAIDVVEESGVGHPGENWWRRTLNRFTWWEEHEGADLLDKERALVSVVVTVIATIAFQAAINPPGGVAQQGINPKANSTDCFTDSYYYTICPGEAMLAYIYPDLFHSYLIFTTISFVASLCVIILLVSGVPLKHKAVMWTLRIGMCATITFLGAAYAYGILLVTPDNGLFYETRRMSKGFSCAWAVLLVLVCLIPTVRLFIWLMAKIKKFKR